MFKKVLAVTALLFASITPVHAEDLSYLNRTISWEDSAPLQTSPIVYAYSGGSGRPCINGWSTSCDPKTGNVTIVNFLPSCKSEDGDDNRLDCLESVVAEKDGVKVQGEPVKKQIFDVRTDTAFNSKPEYGIAKASPFQIYKFPGLSHANGDLFIVYPVVTKNVVNGIVGDTGYKFLIAPISQPNSLINPGGCFFSISMETWCTGSLSSDTKFILSLNLAKRPAGWFSGRISAPEIEIKTNPDGRTHVSISGYSQAIPSINRNYWYSIQSEQEEWSKISVLLPGMSWDKLTADGKRYSMGIPFTSDAIYTYQMVASEVSSFNNADTLKNIWQIESKSSENIINTSCFKSGLTGVVSSNSMTYENAIPSWDSVNSSLTYRIASPHTALGKEFQGRYDLLISEEVAKCLWGLKDLSPSAEINVTSVTGEKKVFTAASSISNGFYKFTAAGFTFSTNKISVKMITQESNPVKSSQSEVTPSPAPSVTPTPIVTQIPAPVTVKKVTITCVKGKVQKKVTAINPKCPTGYKKK